MRVNRDHLKRSLARAVFTVGLFSALVWGFGAGVGSADAQLIGFLCNVDSDCPLSCVCSQNQCVGFDPFCNVPSCGDGLCSSNETCGTCAIDCGACPPPPPPPPGNECSSATICPNSCWCDNGYCVWEGGACPPASSCGNGTCDAGEDFSTCPGDCASPADCTGRVCGPDGAGGSCQPGCSGPTKCNLLSGQCVAKTCADLGFVCGEDPLGNACTPGCATWQDCVNGTCFDPNPAVTIPVTCDFKIRDGFLRRFSGIPVKLQVLNDDDPSLPPVLADGEQLTDANGEALIQISARIPIDPSTGGPVDHRTICEAGLVNRRGLFPFFKIGPEGDPVAKYNLRWTARLVPAADFIHEPPYDPGDPSAPAISGNIFDPTNQRGYGKMRLYLGADRVYDRVLVIVEPFNPAEWTNPRSSQQLWTEYNGNPLFLRKDPAGNPLPPPLDLQTVGALLEEDSTWSQGVLNQLHQAGYDVWIFQPYSTGQDVHEQASELAQGIEFAARTFAAHPRTLADGTALVGSPQDGEIAVFGFSLGGLVTRIATARWADPGEGVWRNGLGLGQPLPVRMIVMGDSPLRGAQVNEHLQQLVWDRNQQSNFNLNSCAAAQMLQRSCRMTQLGSGSIPGSMLPGVVPQGSLNPTLPLCSGELSDIFYNQGGPITHEVSPGIVSLHCLGGPAVLQLDGDGWPDGVTRVAFSNGTTAEGHRCFGDWRDLNPEYENVCLENQQARVLQHGDEWLYVDMPSPESDYHLLYQTNPSPLGVADDLEPGSKHDTVLWRPQGEPKHLIRYLAESRTLGINATIGGVRVKGLETFLLKAGFDPGVFFSAQFRQYSPAGTFIPTRSALDMPCVGCPSSFPPGHFQVNTFNSTHRGISPRQVDFVLGHLSASFAGSGSGGGGGGSSPSSARYLDLSEAEHAGLAAGAYHSSLLGGAKKTWAFWVEPRIGTGSNTGNVAEVWTSDPNRVFSIRLNNFGRRVRVFLFNPAEGDPAFAETADVLTSGWHQVVVQFDGTAVGNAGRLKVFVDGQEKPLEFWGDPVGTVMSTANGAGFEIGELGANLGELAIFNGVPTAQERQEWLTSGIDFSRSDLIAGYRWDDDLSDQAGLNDLAGVAIDSSDFETTTGYPIR